MRPRTAGINYLSLLFLLLFSLLGVSSLFHEGVYTAHDIWHQLARLYHYHNAPFLPTWDTLLANQYGYPLFTFSYHLPWIVGNALMSVGLSLVSTIKILFAVSYIFSGFLMYLFGKLIFKKERSALLCAFLYLWAPHRFSLIFVSAAMGRSFVYFTIPIILTGYALLERKKKGGMITIAIGVAATVLSHMISFLVISPLFLILFISSKYKQKFVISVVLGIGLVSFYVIPAFHYSHLTQISVLSTLHQSNFITIGQILYSKWGYGLPQKFASEGAISYQLGIAQWIVLSISFILIVRKQTRHLILFVGLAIFALFMMTSYSQVMWQIMSTFVTLDYPATFLLVAVTATSILSGYMFDVIHFNNELIFISLVFIALYTNRNHIKANQYIPQVTQAQIDAEVTTNSYDEYLPKNVDKIVLSKELPLALADSPVEIKDQQLSENQLAFNINNPIDQLLVFHQFAFPQVGLYIDGNKAIYNSDPQGLMEAYVKEGKHEVIIKAKRTALEKISFGFSFLFVVLLYYMTFGFEDGKKPLAYPRPS